MMLKFLKPTAKNQFQRRRPTYIYYSPTIPTHHRGHLHNSICQCYNQITPPSTLPCLPIASSQVNLCSVVVFKRHVKHVKRQNRPSPTRRGFGGIAVGAFTTWIIRISQSLSPEAVPCLPKHLGKSAIMNTPTFHSVNESNSLTMLALTGLALAEIRSDIQMLTGDSS
jgi:hypothetical protein